MGASPLDLADRRDCTRRRNHLAVPADRIIESAIGLADEIGVDALTIRKLTTALGVKPMTIYHYVANKEAIIDAMVDIFKLRPNDNLCAPLPFFHVFGL